MTASLAYSNSVINSPEFWRVAGPVSALLILGIGITNLRAAPSFPGIENMSTQQEIEVQKAEADMATAYQSLLKGLNATNLNPQKIENPGLEQTSIINLGIQLNAAIAKQTQDPSHPNFRQTQQGAIVRAILTNASQMLLASEVEKPTVNKHGSDGIVLSYWSNEQQKQISLKMPPEMLSIVAQAYTEALITQLQIGSSAELSTAVQTQQLISGLQELSDSAIALSAYQGEEKIVEQIQDLNAQLATEKEQKQSGEEYVYVIDTNGGVYSEKH